MDSVVLAMIVIGLIIIGIVYITLARKYNLVPAEPESKSPYMSIQDVEAALEAEKELYADCVSPLERTISIIKQKQLESIIKANREILSCIEVAILNGKKYLKVKEFGTEDIKRFCENAFIDYKWFYCTSDGWYKIANVDIGYVYENTLVGILKE